MQCINSLLGNPSFQLLMISAVDQIDTVPQSRLPFRVHSSGGEHFLWPSLEIQRSCGAYVIVTLRIFLCTCHLHGMCVGHRDVPVGVRHDWELLQICFTSWGYSICLKSLVHQPYTGFSDLGLKVQAFTRLMSFSFPFNRDKIMGLEEQWGSSRSKHSFDQ